MKNAIALTAAICAALSILSACSTARNDTEPNEHLDLSAVSSRMTICTAGLMNDFGAFLTGRRSDVDIGIVVRGIVETGRINEGSTVYFVDEYGNVLHRDTVFRIKTTTYFENSDGWSGFSSRFQSFAEPGDDVALYFQLDESISKLIVESTFVVEESILGLMRESAFIVLE